MLWLYKYSARWRNCPYETSDLFILSLLALYNRRSLR